MKFVNSKIFILFFIIHNIFCNTITKHIKQQKDRKLFFSPYLNSFEDYSAKKIGEQEQNDTQPYLGATPVGSDPVNMSSVVPTGFSGGYTLPGSQMFPMGHLGSTQHLETTALYNPLGGNSILNAGNTSLVMGSQGLQQAAGINTMSFATQQFAPPQFKVKEQCGSVLKQAIQIAKTAMENQFQQMADFITKYLSQSRYANEMNELQLTRQLRQDMFKQMMNFANLDVKNIIFGPSGGNYGVNEDMLIRNIKKIAGENISFEKPKIEEFSKKI